MKKLIYPLTLLLILLMTGCGGNTQDTNNFEKRHAELKKERKKLSEFRQKNPELVIKKSNLFNNTKYDDSNQQKYASMIDNYIINVYDLYGEELKFLITQNDPAASARAALLLKELSLETTDLYSLANDNEFVYHRKNEELQNSISQKQKSFYEIIIKTAELTGDTIILKELEGEVIRYDMPIW